MRLIGILLVACALTAVCSAAQVRLQTRTQLGLRSKFDVTNCYSHPEEHFKKHDDSFDDIHDELNDMITSMCASESKSRKTEYKEKCISYKVVNCDHPKAELKVTTYAKGSERCIGEEVDLAHAVQVDEKDSDRKTNIFQFIVCAAGNGVSDEVKSAQVVAEEFMNWQQRKAEQQEASIQKSGDEYQESRNSSGSGDPAGSDGGSKDEGTETEGAGEKSHEPALRTTEKASGSDGGSKDEETETEGGGEKSHEPALRTTEKASGSDGGSKDEGTETEGGGEKSHEAALRTTEKASGGDVPSGSKDEETETEGGGEKSHEPASTKGDDDLIDTLSGGSGGGFGDDDDAESSDEEDGYKTHKGNNLIAWNGVPTHTFNNPCERYKSDWPESYNIWMAEYEKQGKNKGCVENSDFTAHRLVQSSRSYRRDPKKRVRQLELKAQCFCEKCGYDGTERVTINKTRKIICSPEEYV